MTIDFQRTLRIPEKGIASVAAGSGPVFRCGGWHYPDTVPIGNGWRVAGDAADLYQREAMWLSFPASEPASVAGRRRQTMRSAACP